MYFADLLEELKKGKIMVTKQACCTNTYMYIYVYKCTIWEASCPSLPSCWSLQSLNRSVIGHNGKHTGSALNSAIDTEMCAYVK